MPEATADRPDIPYGIVPETEGNGLIPWRRVVDRLRNAYIYWVATVDTAGRPHAIPVWGLWFEDALYFSNGRETRTGRALAANPHVSIHLDGGEDAVIVEGVVEPLNDGDPLIDRLNESYAPKYTWSDRVEEWYRVRPRKAFAWLSPSIGLGADSLYRGTATRWRFR